MVDRRLDMLPRVLAEGICSLHEDTERCALSVFYTIDPRTNTIVDTQFTRTAIRSRFALTYAEAQTIINGAHATCTAAACVAAHTSPCLSKKRHQQNAQSLLRTDLTWLLTFARTLRVGRQAAGAVELDSFASFVTF